MGSKNKGGRETRKPKESKKAKPVTATSVIPPSPHAGGKAPTKAG